MVMMEAFKETNQLLGLLGDFDIFHEHVDIHYNIQSFIQLAKKKVYHSRMKHIDVRFYFIR